MPILTFNGNFVATHFSLVADNGATVDFDLVDTPFTPADTITIEVTEDSVLPNGEFDPNSVEIVSFSVTRGSQTFEFGVTPTSVVNPSNDGTSPLQGDTYFTTTVIEAPSSGPFKSVGDKPYLFSTEQEFGKPDIYTLNNEASDAGGTANGNFNVQSSLICYAQGTMILTSQGPVPVEDIVPGMLAVSLDHGLQPVRLTTRSLNRWPGTAPRHKPILIKAGALGAGLPERDLVVSPQHRMLVPGDDGSAPKLVAAKHLTHLRGVRVKAGVRQVVYVHLLFDRHEVLFANGAASESFLPGPVALRSLPAEDHRKVLRVLRQRGAVPSVSMVYPMAYPALKRSDVVRMPSSQLLWTPETWARTLGNTDQMPLRA